MSKTISLLHTLSSAISNYYALTPSVHKIQAMQPSPLTVDHVAVRSFKSTGGILQARTQLTQDEIYRSGGVLQIPEKKLDAEWFYTTDPVLRTFAPRIFVSELDETKLSSSSQNILKKYARISEGTEEDIVSYDDYQNLSKESEYAGWTLLHGTRINHVALTVPKTSTLIEFIERLKQHNFRLNTIGGEIKTSNDGMLHQASILSDSIIHAFKEEHRNVPGYFVEFVQRDKYEAGSIREGFESQNALHIFDSTNIVEKYT